MGYFSSIFKMPPNNAIGEAFKELQNGIKRVEVNKITVNFYEAHTPFYTEVIGNIYHIGNVSLVRIEIPHKLGWIIMDGSIQINNITKEKRVHCRQDYPLTLSANRQIANALAEAMALFPETRWFIPESISNLPVKQLILKRDPQRDIEVKKLIDQSGIDGAKNLITMIDSMPSDLHILAQTLYDLPDITFGNELTNKPPKINVMFGLLCAVVSALITILMFLYLKV